MNLKQVEPGHLVTIFLLDGRSIQVPPEYRALAPFTKGLWERPPQIDYQRYARALGLKNATEVFNRWLDNY